MSVSPKDLDPAFQGAGQKVGLEIWRIENFRPARVPDTSHGKFYTGDLYIVLKSCGACFPITLFSSSFDHGWSCGTSASAVQGLLGMLVEGGNVNQCFLEASRFGSTYLVHILLQCISKSSITPKDVDKVREFWCQKFVDDMYH